MTDTSTKIPSEPITLEDLRAYLQWMKHTHPVLTQRLIARRADVSKSAVARLELGHDVTYTNGTAILRVLIEHHRANLVGPDTPVSKIMTSPVQAAYSTWTLERLHKEMATRRFTYMPFRDKQRRYGGLIHRERVSGMLDTGVDPAGPLEEHLDELLEDLPPPVDHEQSVSSVWTLLERGPPIRLVERWGQVRGVVTPDNLRRVCWD